MTHHFTATFTNKPTAADLNNFSQSHGVSYRKINGQTYKFYSDNLDYLEETHDQLKHLNPSHIEN